MTLDDLERLCRPWGRDFNLKVAISRKNALCTWGGQEGYFSAAFTAVSAPMLYLWKYASMAFYSQLWETLIHQIMVAIYNI